MKTPSSTTKFFNALGQKLAYAYVRNLMRSDIRWESPIPPGLKIIAANHPTTTDPFLFMSWPFEPIYILITESAFKVPIIGQFLRLAGHIPVITNQGKEAYDTALHLLRNGHSVGIFPEGNLSGLGGTLMPLHTGAVRLAVSANVPLVPAGIALDWHFVNHRDIQKFGVSERMRLFWLGAYEVTAGTPLIFTHTENDREAVSHSTKVLMQEIKRLSHESATRLLDASWPLKRK